MVTEMLRATQARFPFSGTNGQPARPVPDRAIRPSVLARLDDLRLPCRSPGDMPPAPERLYVFPGYWEKLCGSSGRFGSVMGGAPHVLVWWFLWQ